MCVGGQGRQQMPLIYYASYLLSQALFLNLEHSSSAKLAGQQVPEISQLLPSSTWITALDCHIQLLPGCWDQTWVFTPAQQVFTDKAFSPN